MSGVDCGGGGGGGCAGGGGGGGGAAVTVIRLGCDSCGFCEAGRIICGYWKHNNNTQVNINMHYMFLEN